MLAEMFPATITNTITNALHATFLFSYFILSLINYLRGNKNFKTINIVFLFFLIFIEKILGVIVHYSEGIHPLIWTLIALGVFILNWCVSYSMEMPSLPRKVILVTSGLLIGFYLYGLLIADYEKDGENYAYLAFSMLITFSIAAYYSKGLTRIGWILIVISNLSWMVMRYLLGVYLNDNPEHFPQYKYDNDIYHLMLIASTFILYLSVDKGDWLYPKDKA